MLPVLYGYDILGFLKHRCAKYLTPNRFLGRDQRNGTIIKKKFKKNELTEGRLLYIESIRPGYATTSGNYRQTQPTITIPVAQPCMEQPILTETQLA
jgi:hypothetical protein